MCTITEFKKITVEEISSIKFIELNGKPTCRVITNDYQKDFNLGDYHDCIAIDKLKKLVRFFVTLGFQSEDHITCDGALYRNAPNYRRMFSLISHQNSLCKIKRILLNHGITINPIVDVVFSKNLGGYDIYTMVTDYHGKLRKYVGKECANELIEYSSNDRHEFRRKIEAEEYLDTCCI